MVGSLGGFIYRVNNDLVFLLLAAIMVAEAASWYNTLNGPFAILCVWSQLAAQGFLTTTWFNRDSPPIGEVPKVKK